MATASLKRDFDPTQSMRAEKIVRLEMTEQEASYLLNHLDSLSKGGQDGPVMRALRAVLS